MANDSGYKALVEKMGAVYAEMKKMCDDANDSGEGMSDALEAKYSALKMQYASLTAQRQRSDELMNVGAGFKAEAPEAPKQVRNLPGIENASNKSGRNTETDEYRNAWGSYIRSGEYTNPMEIRAISEASGGTVLPPLEFHNAITTKLKTMTAIRQIAKVISIGSYAREFAVESTTGSAAWAAEAASFTESGSTFAKVTLTPAKLTGLLKVSNELVEDAPARGAGFSIETILTEQFARMFAQAEETAFCATSSVTSGPQNPLLSSGAGISTGKTTASNSVITAAEVIDWVYSLARQYRTNASILVHDATLGKLRQLGALAGTVNYFWQNSGALGEPDRLMGIPVYASAAMPTIATTAKIGVIGDFGNYSVLAERGTYSMRVLKELYAANGQTGYIASNRVDFAVTLPSAFSVLACAV
ncbi:MAG: phage major capsid protein [Actinobacteria bacterium]|nr:phage major capsid protein [Actinomycetota bacterium]